MSTISFMTANFVARQAGYQMTQGWMQGENATMDYFRPIETYRERLDTYLSDAAALGFSSIDLWLAILHREWATPEHIAIAKDLLAQHDLKVTSLAGYFGDTLEEFAACCKLAKTMNTSVLGGITLLVETHREKVARLLEDYDLRFGLENENEKTPRELLAKLGDNPRIGTTVDTGWWATQGYSAPQAIHEVRDRLVHIHLKDIRAVGAHHTCRYGDGVVGIKACVDMLQQIGYTGAITVEHESESYDPTDEIRESFGMLKMWLSVQ